MKGLKLIHYLFCLIHFRVLIVQKAEIKSLRKPNKKHGINKKELAQVPFDNAHEDGHKTGDDAKAARKVQKVRGHEQNGTQCQIVLCIRVACQTDR